MELCQNSNFDTAPYVEIRDEILPLAVKNTETSFVFLARLFISL